MKRILLALAALFALANISFAGTNSASFYVYATVVPTCWISATNIAFPDYSGVQSSATGTVSVWCNTTGTGYTAALDAGQHYTSTWRHMAMGSDLLRYYITQPGGGEWGDTGYGDTYQFGGAPPSGTSSGGTDSLTMTATTFGGQSQPAGQYLDVVTATVHF